MKKIKILSITILLIMAVLTTTVNAYSAEVELSSKSKLEEGKEVEVKIKLENIDATESGVSVVKGRITYDTTVFENYSVEAKNGWESENNNNTFLFKKQTGVTSNEEVAIIKFKVKGSISKSSAEIKFSNITASGIVKSNGGPGDIKVAGATLKLTKTEVPIITKENLSNKTQIGASKSLDNELPHAGKSEIVLFAIVIISVSSIVIYRRYKTIDR